MAKGDHGRMQDEINEQKGLLQHGYGYNPGRLKFTSPGKLERVGGTPGVGGMENLTREMTDFNNTAKTNYSNSLQKSLQSYDDIMAAYKGFKDNPDVAGARSTFGDMASTGGGINVAAMRDRAMQPVRSMYSSANREVNRSASLAGGYAPNRIAALAKMNRDASIQGSDAATNAEAAIQGLISQNRLSGARGLADLGQMDLANTGGMADMYSRTPGMTNMFGNQLLAGQNNLLQSQGLMNEIARMMMGARAQNAQIPGNFSQAMGNIGDVLGLGGKVVGSLAGLGNPFGGGSYVGNQVRGIEDQIFGKRY